MSPHYVLVVLENAKMNEPSPRLSGGGRHVSAIIHASQRQAWLALAGSLGERSQRKMRNPLCGQDRKGHSK